MTTTPDDPDRELRAEIESAGEDVFRTSPKARRQDILNNLTAFLTDELRKQGRESETMTPRQIAEMTDAALQNDPHFVARLKEGLGEEVVEQFIRDHTNPFEGLEEDDHDTDGEP